MNNNKYTWLKNYPTGVPVEINADAFHSIPDLMKECFQKYSNLPSFVNMGKEITYKDLDTYSLRFASFLQNELHLKKGERVAIQMPNLLQYPIVMFGALRAGLVVVNNNPLYTPREMQHQLNDSGAETIIILENFCANLQQIKENTKIKNIIVTEIGDMLGGFKKHIVNFVVKKVKKMVPNYNIPGIIKFENTINKKYESSFTNISIKGDDLAYLQYTGGTTGVSKGAMLTHRNIIANLEQVSAWMAISNLENGKEVVITALPLYHIFALTCNCLCMCKIGAKNILITNPRDMPNFLKELKKYPFSVITGVNTLFNGLMNQPNFLKLDFSKVKIALGGGMAVQIPTIERWKKLTNTSLIEGYGLTETSPVATANPFNGTDKPGYIGIPVPSTEVILLNDAGEEVKQGEPGEICVKGPQVMKGYWQRPEETDKVFIRGYFKTGDIGFMETDGFFKIIDRKKEMILVSGFNVYPNEIEAAISLHPKVLEVGVIGVPDLHSSEVPKAFIVKKDDSLTEQEIIAFCHKNITGYKVPKHIEFTKELPKSNVGKILRRVLKENDEKKNKYI
ncbi:MAG: AMP-binding protein [Chitinophagaceae bacterium]|nr:AMP-binding protein [Chitinophagaceae bacterium]